MKLPNYKDAIIDDNKLLNYCLNENHLRGKHKAVVFKSALGFTRENYSELKQLILNAIQEYDAHLFQEGEFGKLYYVDFTVVGRDGIVTVRSTWIVKKQEKTARLTSCFVNL